MPKHLYPIAWFALPVALLAAPPAHGANEPEFALTIRDHRFTPAEVRIPANVKVKLVVDNQDSAPEEFDSHALNREKVIPGKAKATIFIGPLAPGRYPFMGEFNAATAQGAVVAE
ncbi:MAG TPA: cupredoxin domain-containing protein [Casimicrobiaceae bacterium]|nr:cupredoxin domain-containing protein [Casimicrobiaceae bacterium]